MGTKRKNTQRFDQGAVIVLFMICIGLLIILLHTVLYGAGEDKANGLMPETMNESSQMNDGTITESVAEESLQSTESDTAEEEESLQPVGNMGNTEEQEASEPEFYEFTAGEKSYFDDALFIGDSRTVGLREYGTLDNADYFASSGLNLYKIDTAKVKYHGDRELTLDELLTHNTYGKIYVMLGINELGYHFDRTVEKYEEFIAYLRTLQPDAILYVCANLHVNSLRDELDEIHNNEAINRMNQKIAEFADQKEIFYLDVNPLFDDEDGNLSNEYISDDSHLTGKYYEQWCDWFCENVIVK